MDAACSTKYYARFRQMPFTSLRQLDTISGRVGAQANPIKTASANTAEAPHIEMTIIAHKLHYDQATSENGLNKFVITSEQQQHN